MVIYICVLGNLLINDNFVNILSMRKQDIPEYCNMLATRICVETSCVLGRDYNEFFFFF